MQWYMGEKERGLTRTYNKSRYNIQTDMSKGQSDNTNNATKCSITQRLRLRTYLGQSVGVTTATQQVWVNRFTSVQPSH